MIQFPFILIGLGLLLMALTVASAGLVSMDGHAEHGLLWIPRPIRRAGFVAIFILGLTVMTVGLVLTYA